MTLNTWSLIIFATHALFYLGMIFAMSGKADGRKLSFMIGTWIVNQIAITWYGLATSQIGFILISAFQFAATLLTLVILINKEFNSASQ